MDSITFPITHTGEDDAVSLLAAGIVMVVIPTVALMLRFWSRFVSPDTKIWLDDYFALAGMPFFVAVVGLVLRWRWISLGRHITDLTPESVIEGFKLFYAAAITYILANALPKYSALFFYQRTLRSGDRLFKYALWTGLVFNTGALISSEFATAFQCTPVGKAWDLERAGHCFTTFSLVLGVVIVNLVLDLYILILPLPVIYKLKLSLRQRLLLTGLFIFGYGVIVVSIGRLVWIAQNGNNFAPDPDWRLVPYIYWSILETPIAITCVCMPACFQLAKRGWHHGAKALFNARRYPEHSSSHRQLLKKSSKTSSKATAGSEKIDGPDTGSHK